MRRGEAFDAKLACVGSRGEAGLHDGDVCERRARQEELEDQKDSSMLR